MGEPLTKERILSILRDEMASLRKQYGVAHIALFGSFATGGATAGSDVDLIVAFTRPVGLEFVDLAEHLEQALGRSVHLVTMDTLERGLRLPRYRDASRSVQETLVYV